MTFDGNGIPPEHLELGYRIASRHGFATPRSGNPVLTPNDRRRLVRNRGVRAVTALTQLQQWLADDDPVVREDARANIARCLRVAYTGERREPVGFMDRVVIRRLDGAVEHALGRGRDADRPEPRWARPSGIRAIRFAGISAALAFAVTAMFLLAFGHPAVALAAISAAAILDMAEGSFARATRAHDAQLRWFSCVISHLGDVLILSGVFWAEQRAGTPGSGYVVLGAGLVSLFASLVRVSALQAGFRFWRSPLERVVRFTGFVAYCIASAVGSGSVGAAAVSVLLIAFALGEIVRVVWRIAEHQVGRGGFIFLTDDSATCWSFEEAETDVDAGYDRWDDVETISDAKIALGTGGGVPNRKSP